MAAASQVVGVRDTLAKLKKVEPKLRRQVTSQMRRAAKPVQRGIQNQIPTQTPMSGWTSGRYGFDGGAARKGVKIKAGGRASRKKSVWPLLSIEQRNAGGAVFDMAGRRSSGNTPSGRAFIRTLNARHGRASRSMWKGAEAKLPEVQKEVLRALATASKSINRELDVRGR